MKKSSILFLLFFSAALPAFSASTCETRVDAHQDATTLERAAYCLTPEEEPPAPEGQRLLYYSVSNKTPKQGEAEPQDAYKQKYFDKKDLSVRRNYVETRAFPEFTNDTLSEQECLALEQAEKEALEKAHAEAMAKVEKKNSSLDGPSVLDEKEPKMSKAQLAVRKTKPNRVMNSEAQEEEPSGFEEPAYPTDTPAGELQQAQAWENNPLDVPSGNAGGAADGFSDDNLLVDPSFGYDADPAMMP